MLRNNIEADVKAKCIQTGTNQVKIARDIGITPSYINRMLRKRINIVNKTYIRILESLGYDIELTYVKRETGSTAHSDIDGVKGL